MRSIEDIVQLIRMNLEAAGSNLARFSRFSQIYLIIRSIAALISEQEYKLEVANQDLFITSASGTALEKRALDYGLIRQTGSLASGTILIRTNTERLILPSDLILSTADSKLQFRLLEGGIVNTVESAFRIEALNIGTESNLLAGTQLYSSFFPQATFTVGQYRDLALQSLIGNLSGGQLPETDDLFRSRILLNLRSIAKGTKTAIESELLSIPGINRVEVQEAVPSVGYLTIFVNTQNASTLQQAAVAIEQVKAAGIAYYLKPFEYRFLNLSVLLRIKPTVNSNEVSTLARQYINDYFQVAGVEQIFDPSLLQSYLLQIPGVSAVRIQTPTQPLLLEIGTLLQPSNLTLTFEEGT